MKLLLSGFEPFGIHSVNPSWEVAQRIAAQPPKDVDVLAKRLPVSYTAAWPVLKAAIKDFQPDVVLMMGVASKRSGINYERVAINLDDSASADNDKIVRTDSTIRKSGASAYFSTLPVKAMRDATLACNIEAKVSNSAGNYVCNHTMYECLHYLRHSKCPSKACFIHLPALSNTATMTLADMEKAVRAAIAALVNDTTQTWNL